jgi:hypothetical protein
MQKDEQPESTKKAQQAGWQSVAVEAVKISNPEPDRRYDGPDRWKVQNGAELPDFARGGGK